MHERVGTTERQPLLIEDSMKDMASSVAVAYGLKGPIAVIAKNPYDFGYVVAIGEISPTFTINSKGKVSNPVTFHTVFETDYGTTASGVIARVEVRESDIPIICDKKTTGEISWRDWSIEIREDSQFGSVGKNGTKYYVIEDFAARGDLNN